MASEPPSATTSAVPSGISAARAEEMMADCLRWRAKAMQDPTVTFMLSKMSESGCPVPADAIQCLSCGPDSMLGGFHPEMGIVLCVENVTSAAMVQEVITHEMVHAFDECRAVMDWNNCLIHACSEIRASNLSGECKWSNEFNRGHYNYGGQQQECVKRRALLSVHKNPACQGDIGIAAVEKAWAVCIKDTRPFDFQP
eukprot:c21429_g1_i1.p1 GENE.c21429_g1_i1~~c21429_g1_i1.p1  ORF type:complete len:198 (+),score=30.08 c21429_g1_i1:141-734(+)